MKHKEFTKLRSCKDCYFFGEDGCTQTSPPTKILSEHQAQGCTKYTTSTSVVVTT